MHNPVKLILLLPLMLICSCSDGVTVRTEDSEYRTDTACANFSLPRFEYSPNAAYADSVNSEFDNTASAILDDFLAKEAPSLDADTEIMRNDGRIVSVILEGEVETGKAHGEKFRVARTYDFANGRAVGLEELFDGDAWKQLADNKMKALAEKGEGDYEDLWEMPSVALLSPENYYIKEKTLILYFPPYELSYYRRGYVEFEFEKEELSTYLSDYGREIL